MNHKAFAIATLTLALAAIGLTQSHPTSKSQPRGPVDPSLYSGLVWRNVGPFRGGRVSAVSGALGAGQTGVFYAGMPGGGVWKSTNAGINWEPIFDSVPTASSVGSVQVAPTDPNIVYVGLGDATTGTRSEGDGVYKSIDAGKTWIHIGLEFAKQIPSLLVDPKDPNIVLAAVLGDSRTANGDRGVYRTTDGGKTWTKTMTTDPTTGVQNLAWAFDNPKVILATTKRSGSTTGTADKLNTSPIKGTMVVKSTDGGLTWNLVKGKGLPDVLSGRACAAVAMNTQSRRMFFVCNNGLFRSDDGGDTWKQMDKEDGRIRNGQGGYNCGVYVNTKDPDTVYVFNTCSYISHDGGKTFTGFKGAPGGDDPQQMWLDPTDANRMFMGVDQGPTVSLDGGKSWSGWYNVANGQFYHIAVSNSSPYWIYANMQDSGAIGMASRGIYGQISPLDWSPNPGWEWGDITVDPLNPNTIYSTGQSNDLIKQSFPTGQWQSVGPDNDPKLGLHHDFNQPMMFSPVNPHELLLGYQFLMASTDGGKSYHKLSPDLTLSKAELLASLAPKKPEKKVRSKPAPKLTPSKNEEKIKKANEAEPNEETETVDDGDQNINPKEAMEHADELQRRSSFGAISTLSPSSISNGIIWAGISNGMVKLTQDHGKSWDDVNIPNNKSSIVCIDASHTNSASAYVVVSSSSEPIVYRTKDFGKSWTKIVTGLPTDEVTGSKANVIRADTKKDGLLFLGTESSMYTSFDDGDHWQSLKLNSPNTSYRDMVIKDNDLVVGTYGRSFWILDDISPLRQVNPSLHSAYLFAPGEATRIRRNVGQDTPMPPEVPHALNAPAGSLIYYYLGSKPKSELTIDITDKAGQLIRHYSSVPVAPLTTDLQPIPDFWKEVPAPLSLEVGNHRFNWDLRYANPPATSYSYDISANPYLTPLSPQGPLVLPGIYTVTMKVDGQSFSQKLMVKNDPRSPARGRDLQQQHLVQMKLLDLDIQATSIISSMADLRGKLDGVAKPNLPKEINDLINSMIKKMDSIKGASSRGRGFGATASTIAGVASQSVGLMAKMEFGDMAPSQPTQSAVTKLQRDFDALSKVWDSVLKTDLPMLNEKLSSLTIPAIALKP